MCATSVISFDLDDTLWPVAPVLAAAEAALQEWLRERYPRTMHGHSINTMRALRAKIAAQFPEQSHDLTFLRRRSLAEQFIGAGYAESACEEALEVFLAARNRVEFFDDVRPALERLCTRYRLFALSNGNADPQRCGLGAFFDGHVSAIGAGAAKPDARIFAALRDLAGVPADEMRRRLALAERALRLPPEKAGEIIVRGDNVMMGYWERPEETARAVIDGWMHTGDSGYMDQDGFIYVVDRVKDMIISGGENVYSVEVENALAQHPAVAQCAVIGIPDERWGETVHAVVVTRSGAKVTAGELIEFSKTLIAGYKCPRSVDISENPLPLSGAGKVLKRALRQPFWENRERHVS